MLSAQILIVEDEVSLLKIYKEELTSAGHECIGVRSGEEAAALIDSQKFDVVIADLNLAGSMSGIALLGKCSRDFLKMKIIVITGMTGLEDTAFGKSGFPGSNQTLFKPFDYGELTRSVENALAG